MSQSRLKRFLRWLPIFLIWIVIIIVGFILCLAYSQMDYHYYLPTQ